MFGWPPHPPLPLKMESFSSLFQGSIGRGGGPVEQKGRFLIGPHRPFNRERVPSTNIKVGVPSNKVTAADSFGCPLYNNGVLNNILIIMRAKDRPSPPLFHSHNMASMILYYDVFK